MKYEGSSEKQKLALLPVEKRNQIYKQLEGGGILTNNTFAYYSKGGWLKQSISFISDKQPFLFPSYCSNGDNIVRIIKIHCIKIK